MPLFLLFYPIALKVAFAFLQFSVRCVQQPAEYFLKWQKSVILRDTYLLPNQVTFLAGVHIKKHLLKKYFFKRYFLGIGINYYKDTALSLFVEVFRDWRS